MHQNYIFAGYDCGVYVITFVERICQFLTTTTTTTEKNDYSLPDLSLIESSEMIKQRTRLKSIIKELQS